MSQARVDDSDRYSRNRLTQATRARLTSTTATVTGADVSYVSQARLWREEALRELSMARRAWLTSKREQNATRARRGTRRGLALDT